MASKSDFPSCENCTEILQYIFNIDDMAPKNLYKDDRNVLLRQHAVSVIAKVTKKDELDGYVPYLAMNYFDRFINRYEKRDVDGKTDAEKVRLIAISCFTLSAQRRSSSFLLHQFLFGLYRDMNLRISHDMVTRMERRIMEKLRWKMKPVTAFWFLDHFYSHFKPLGLKHRSINEIIVQTQGEHTFVDFMPSDIAFSACVAAAKIAYPSEELPEDIKIMVEEIVKMMMELCHKMNILIEYTPKSRIHSASQKVEAVPQKETKQAGTVVADSSKKEEDGTALIDKQRQDMGKSKTEASQLQMKEKLEEASDKIEVVIEGENRSLAKGKDKGKEVEKVKEPQTHIGESAIVEIEPRKRMNFELKWATDVPPLEEETEYVQPQESTAISLRIPGTAKNINIGFCTCNIS